MRRRLSERTVRDAVLFELRKAPGLLAGMAAGTIGYSAGHAALAFGAGSLAASLGGSPSAWTEGFLGPVLTPAYVGLVGAFVKALGATTLAHSERTLASRTTASLRAEALERILGSGASVPAPKALAALAVRLREVETAIIDGHLASVRSIAQLVPLAACLTLLAPALSMLALVLAAPFALLLARARNRSRGAAGRAQGLAEELECGVDDLVRNADLFRTYGATRPVLAGVAAASREAGKAAARVDSHRAALSSLNEILGVLAVIAALSLRGHAPALGGAALLPFAAVFFMGYRPLRDLGDARSFIERGALALGAMGRIALEPNPARAVRTVPSPRLPGALELRAFGARARGPRTTLVAEPGEFLCLVGPTGSGKTTLLRSILGLEPSTGQLTFAGEDVTDRAAGPADRPFAWVPQDAPLVTGTLARNVMLTGADEPEARRALRQLGAETLLGIGETETIGPGGRPLSGGERRLVSIARAVSSGLPVLLLDEPTEGLDEVSAEAVLRALTALRGERTMIVATHRDEVRRVADRVVEIGSAGRARAAE